MRRGGGEGRMGMRGRLIEVGLLTRRGMVLCCAVLVVLLALNALVFFGNTQTLLNQEHWVTHTQAVVSTLNVTRATITDAESAQRGYILTGNTAYYGSYNHVAGMVLPIIGRLKGLVADNQQEVQRVTTLRDLTVDLLSELSQGVRLQRAGQTAQAQSIVLADTGKPISDDIRGVLDTMTRTELGFLNQRTARASSAATTTMATLVVAMVVDAALLAGALLVIRRSYARRAQLADERGRLLAREQQARAEAEAAVKARDEFLSLAAHELKTPLTTVIGNAQLLQLRSDGLEPRDQRLVAAIVHGTDRLRALAEHLLDVSHLEQGTLALELYPLDLAALAERVVLEIQPSSPRHTLRVAPVTEEIIARADRLRLEQVIHGLLANAIKYSPNGGDVVVALRRAGDRACISISDQGIGIPPDARERLFERFYRAPNVGIHAYSGLGMGLYLAREIVARHGGTIRVGSTEGQGSTFTIELPAEPAPPRREENGPDPELPATQGFMMEDVEATKRP